MQLPVKKENQKLFHFSEEKRRECVISYLVHKSLKKVGELTGVNRHTLAEWKDQPWWRDIEAEIVTEHAAKFDQRLSKLLETSIEKLQERIEEGELKLAKDGQQVSTPISAKDLAYITKTIFDTRQVLRNLPTSIQKRDDTLLNILAEKLRKVALTASIEETEIIDIEAIEETGQ